MTMNGSGESALERRLGGILLHPTSLHGPHGIGDLGSSCTAWLDWLSRAGCSLWQVLPLGPTGYGDSPYQSFSSFAGNPFLISPERLVEDGLLQQGDLGDPAEPEGRVDFGRVIPYKRQLLHLAAHHFADGAASHLRPAFEAFCQRQASWLTDFARFMAIKDWQGGRAWTHWPGELGRREPAALERADADLAAEIEAYRLQQFIFFRQWDSVRAYARQRGLTIIGDIPIFVAHDSSDVWANQSLFALDPSGEPALVAGVPPDYFAPTGQLWGNPLYQWEEHRQSGYAWWIARFRSALQMVDVVRLDHFRGFAGYWEIPAGAPTAETGRWVEGPGSSFLHAVKDALHGLPIIAEDLGFITPDVIALRDEFGLPGMRILQFGFDGDPAHPFLPHNYQPRCVVYTGTHDNDTVLGWFESAPAHEKDFCLRYLATQGTDLAFDLVRAAWSSVAVWAVAQLQDVLALGPDARMNLPGTGSGNWSWRLLPDQLRDERAEAMRELNTLYGRLTA